MCLSLMRGRALAGLGKTSKALQHQRAAVVQAPASTFLKPRIQERLMSVLPSAQAAQHAAGGGGGSSSSTTEKSADYDPLRDGPLRFLGYSNELGEAFGMLVPHHVVLATYVVAISYVLVDTLDKFSRARQNARETLSIAASAQVNPTVDVSAATAAAFANANPADPPHLTKAEKAAKKEAPDLTVANPSTAALNSSVASMAASSSSSSSSSGGRNSANGRPSVEDLQPGSVSASSSSTTASQQADRQQPEQADMFSEMMPLAGAGGGVWQNGQGSGVAAGIQQSSSSSNGQEGVGAGLAQGLDDAAGMIDAAGVVSGTGGGAGSMGSKGGGINAKAGAGKKFYLTQEEENAALVVGGLKALDTVIWQMLASVMIPGFIIHQSVRLVAQVLASPAGTKSMVMGASAVGRVVGAEAAAVLPTYIENALPVALGLALIPIICHPIDSVVDKLLDSTLRPVLRKYRLQLQQTKQREGPL